MKRFVSLFSVVTLLAAPLAGCGGSESSNNGGVIGNNDSETVNDGRSVVVRLDQSVALGNNTFFTVRSIDDNRNPVGVPASGASYAFITGSLSRRNDPAPAESFTMRLGREESVRFNSTGVVYRFGWNELSPPRGPEANIINQENFRLTFRITQTLP